jgi:AraC-like DNA-binding protein
VRDMRRKNDRQIKKESIGVLVFGIVAIFVGFFILAYPLMPAKPLEEYTEKEIVISQIDYHHGGRYGASYHYIITEDGERYNITNPTVIFLPPLSRYIFSIKTVEETKVSVFNFDLTQLAPEIKTSLGTPTVTTFDPTLALAGEDIDGFSKPIVRYSSVPSAHISAAVKAYAVGRGAYLERSSAYLKLALLTLIDDGETEYSPLVKETVAYIKSNLSDHLMTNESIARALNYHPYYLNRVIKRELGVSLRSYVIGVRLDAACHALCEGVDGISEVAARVGFLSPSYFVKMFKNREGVTPREYRKMNRSVQL